MGVGMGGVKVAETLGEAGRLAVALWVVVVVGMTVGEVEGLEGVEPLEGVGVARVGEAH